MSDVSESLSVPDTHHSDNKKGKLDCARHPNHQQSNDSVVDNELSKSQSSGSQKRDMGMKYEDFLEVNRERYNRLAVHSIVVSDLFPRIKFLDKYKDLEYSSEEGTICHYVLNTCQLNYDSNQEEILWEKAKKWIMSSITRLRSDKSTAMQKELYSKLYTSDFVFFK